MEIKYKKLPTFTCDVEKFVSILTRIDVITGFGQKNANTKQCILVTSEDKLYAYGITPDVTSYLSIGVDVTDEGICVIPTTEILGLLKKRKGEFSFEAADNNFSFKSLVKNTSFKGTFPLREMNSDIKEVIESIADDIKDTKGVPLSAKMMDEIKRAVKMVSSKHIISGDNLNIVLRCQDGHLKLATSDGFRAVSYEGSTEYKSRDFELAVTGTAYDLIDKFVEAQPVNFTVGNTLQLIKKKEIYAAIPPIQASEEEYADFDNVTHLLSTDNFDVEFELPNSICESIQNMSILKGYSLENEQPTKFNLKKIKNKEEVEEDEVENTKGKGKVKYKYVKLVTNATLELEYKTASGCINEGIKVFKANKSKKFSTEK